MFDKIKTWWANRKQSALCKAEVCDLELVSIHLKTEGCQKFTRIVKQCPICSRRQVENHLTLEKDNMEQTYPEVKKISKPKKKAAPKKKTVKAAK